jgi:hypothetical protein
MTHPSDENRWYRRRKFWFASGILADRRSGIERRSGNERRVVKVTAPVVEGQDRRLSSARRAEGERRSGERRQSDRRPAV